MYNIHDSYTKLYHEKMQKAEWYKKPAVRTTFKTAGVVTIVALVVIASMSAHALSHPLSSVGTIGQNALGAQGLTAVTAAGFTGSAVLSVVLIVYLRKSVFRVSDYVHEDKGFLYAIKDGDQTLKGYLYGTIHMMPHHWKDINSQIQGKLDECRKVIVECHEIPVSRRRGIDFKLMDHAREKNIELEQFETFQKQLEIWQSFSRAIVQDAIENLSCSRCCSSSRPSMSTEESIDRTVMTWQTGDEASTANLLLSMTNGQKLRENLQRALTNIIGDRNTKWMPKIQQELEEVSDRPCLIAVGTLHLFDYDMIKTTGLIAQIRAQGWTVERVDCSTTE